jgi:DNA-binding CsgD family transcriptional regulator
MDGPDPSHRRLPELADGFEAVLGELRVVSVPLEPDEWPPALTGAEREVARCLIRGESLAGVAGRRGTSLHTVAAQVRQMREKLDVTSIAELVAHLARRGAAER